MFVTQSIQRPHGITVFGSHVLRVEPDCALVTLGVYRIEPEPAKAFAATRDAIAQVRRTLTQADVAAADVQTSHVKLSMEHEGYGKERVFMGYRAHVGLSVRLLALPRFEELLAAVVAAGVNQIDGTSFRTTRLAELRTRARREAFAAAKRKAGLYAEEAGLQLGDVLHIEDLNPERLQSRGSHGTDIDLDGDDAPVQPSAPGSIEVQAAVMVSFAIAHGKGSPGFA